MNKEIDELIIVTCDVSTSAGLDRFRKTYPDKYLDIFQAAKENYFIFRDKINPKEIKIECPEKDIDKLKEYLVNDIEMSDKRVQNTLKKFHNNYK